MEQLEEDVKIGYGMVQRRGEDIIKLNLVINDLKKDHLEKDEMIKEFQKKKEISDKIIKQLITSHYNRKCPNQFSTKMTPGAESLKPFIIPWIQI